MDSYEEEPDSIKLSTTLGNKTDVKFNLHPVYWEYLIRSIPNALKKRFW
jgi:hypothetical protein